MLIAVAKHYAAGEESPPKSGQTNGGDNYEKALPIIKQLIASGAQDKRLPAWGYLAAFATNDYDLADSYAKQLQANGLLADPERREGSSRSGGAQHWSCSYMQLSRAISRALGQGAGDPRRRGQGRRPAPRAAARPSKGDIVIELFENEAPQAVGQLHHARRARASTTACRFTACCRSSWPRAATRRATAAADPVTSIRCECRQPNYRHHFRGSLSMARLPDRDTGGSQFFLTFVPTPHLDGKHTVFGRVIEGMEVLGELQKRDPQSPTATGARQDHQGRSAPPTRPRIQIRKTSRPLNSPVSFSAANPKPTLAVSLPSPRHSAQPHPLLLQDQPIIARDEQPILLTRVLNQHDPLAGK